jgi:hypothetical protein
MRAPRHLTNRSVKGTHLTGVYSDGKTLVARGALVRDGEYALTLQNIDGAAPLDPPAPAEAAAAAPAEGAGAAPAAPAPAAAAPPDDVVLA